MNRIRWLSSADIPSVMRLNRAAGWNQTEQDWERLLRLEPHGCFALEAGGAVVCTTTAVCYGSRLAWVGMVLTDPEHRGKGYATRLMQVALDWLRGRGVEWIKLDATDMGRPIYLKLGFQDEAPVERWSWTPRPVDAPSLSPGTLDFELDLEAFGACRKSLLEDLSRPGEMAVTDGGYAFGRPGANAAYFGPCVATSITSARKLLQWFLNKHAGEAVYWDILPDNHDALQLAVEFGFERRRQLMRMVARGVAQPEPFRRRDEFVYAIAGFEYG